MNREFYADRPNENWLTDVTAFKYYDGPVIKKLYLSAFLDLYDRRIVAYAKLLVTVAADQLIALRENQSKLEAEMLNLCKQLPEYETVMAMYGVGKSTGPHLMAELGDVRRFPHRSSIVAFAGVDPGVVGSGKMQLSSVTTSKRGSPQLRKALFQVVSTYVKCKPENEAVYQFYAKKRDEGKPFFVCTTAAANKFLRIYYARVKECLNAAESATQVEEG